MVPAGGAGRGLAIADAEPQGSQRHRAARLGARQVHHFGKRFAELAAEQQSEALIEVEENSRAFFDLILTHTRQGFYGDPRHGGNRNMASWKMVGLPFPPVRGRERYEDQPKVG